MKSIDSVGVTFVNVLVGHGFYNGVVNLTFGAFQFTPDAKDNTVDPDLVVASRMRMDLNCAMQLHAALGKVLDSIPKTIPANGGISGGEAEDEPVTPSSKPN